MQDPPPSFARPYTPNKTRLFAWSRSSFHALSAAFPSLALLFCTRISIWHSATSRHLAKHASHSEKESYTKLISPELSCPFPRPENLHKTRHLATRSLRLAGKVIEPSSFKATRHMHHLHHFASVPLSFHHDIPLLALFFLLHNSFLLYHRGFGRRF